MSTEIELPSTLQMTGFSLDWDTDISIRCELRLLGSERNGTWSTVGSSSYRLAPDQILFLSQKTLLRGNHWSVDYRPTWPLIAASIMNPLLSAMACLGSALLGTAGQRELARLFFAWLALLLALSQLIAAAGLASAGQSPAFLPAVRAATAAGLAAVVGALEWAFFDYLRIFAVCNLGARLADDCALLGDCAALAANPPRRLLRLRAQNRHLLAGPARPSPARPPHRVHSRSTNGGRAGRGPHAHGP